MLPNACATGVNWPSHWPLTLTIIIRVKVNLSASLIWQNIYSVTVFSMEKLDGKEIEEI